MADLIQKAKSLFKKGDLAGAQNILAQKPVNKSATADSLLGLIRHKLGKTDEAISFLEKAVRRSPGSAEFHNNLGVVYRESGNFKKALACYEKALALAPDYPDALFNKGTVLASLSRFEEAKKLLTLYLDYRPGEFVAWYCLGNVHLNLKAYHFAVDCFDRTIQQKPGFTGAIFQKAIALTSLHRLDEAVAEFNRVISLGGNHARAYNNMGIIYMKKGEYDTALNMFELAEQSDPDLLDACMNKGIVLKEKGLLNKAYDCYHQVLELAPENVQAMNLMTDILKLQERYEEAIVVFEKALGLDSDNYELLNNYGNTLQLMGKFKQASKIFEKLTGDYPESPEPWLNKALALRDGGNMEQAHAAFEKSLEIDPGLTKTVYTFGDMHRYTLNDRHFTNLQQIEQGLEAYDVMDRIPLLYALGKAYEDVQEYDKSFAYYQTGAGLKRAIVDYDEQKELMEFLSVKKAATAELLNEYAGQGYESELPVFIVGMPRSGTTLVEQILSSHSMVYGAGELYEMGRVLHQWQITNKARLEPARDMYLPPGFEHVADLTPAQRGELYIQKLRKLGGERVLRVTDKMPRNHKWLGFINIILPKAKIIHCRRDPADTCFSCYRKLFNSGQHWSYDLSEAGRYYKHKHYRELMDHWKKLLGNIILEVDYEDLVNDFENQAGRIVRHAGLEWEDACLRFYESKRTVRTASSTQVRKPVYKTAVKRWKKYEKYLPPLLEELDLTHKNKTSGNTHTSKALLQKGFKLHEKKKFQEAEGFYWKVLELNPAEADAWHLLGLAAKQQGNAGRAVELIWKALELQPENMVFLNNMGTILRQSGKTGRALECYEKAVSVNPQYVDALGNLASLTREMGHFKRSKQAYENLFQQGVKVPETYNGYGAVLQSLGLVQEAHQAYDKAIELKSTLYGALQNKAVLFNNQGLLNKALSLFDRCLEIKPDYIRAHINKGKTLFELNRYEEALECYDNVLAMDPANSEVYENMAKAQIKLRLNERAVTSARTAVNKEPGRPEAYGTLGDILKDLDQKEESVKAFEGGLQIKPDFAALWCNKGNVHRQYGESEKARLCYDKAIRYAPYLTEAHRMRTSLYTYTEEDIHFKTLLKLEDMISELDRPRQVELHYALAKVYQDVKDFDGAFFHYEQGGRCKRSLANYNEANSELLFTRIRQAVNGEFIDSMAGQGYRSSLPVFVLGMPRSGTTLIEQILSSHPSVYGAGELNDLLQVFCGWNIKGGINFSSTIYPEYKSLEGQKTKVSDRGKAYCRRLVNIAGNDCKYVINKLPDNFLYIGLIQALLPDATIIHCRRYPVDTCLSCFQILFTDAQEWSYDLKELGRYYKLYEGLMAHWRNVLPYGRIIEIDYERVVSDLTGSARFLLDRLDLDWHENCSNFYEQDRPVTTASVTQVRRPVYKSSVKRWKNYEKHLGPLLVELDNKT